MTGLEKDQFELQKRQTIALEIIAKELTKINETLNTF